MKIRLCLLTFRETNTVAEQNGKTCGFMGLQFAKCDIRDVCRFSAKWNNRDGEKYPLPPRCVSSTGPGHNTCLVLS